MSFLQQLSLQTSNLSFQIFQLQPPTKQANSITGFVAQIFGTMNNQQKFTTFLSRVQSESIFPNCIKQNSKKYDIYPPQLVKLSPSEIQRLRRIILDKKENDLQFKKRIEDEWNQCEKKIFNWILLCYTHLHSKDIHDLSEEDLHYLADISTNKSIPLIKYQICSLVKQESRQKWSQEQDKHLHQILAVQQVYKAKGEWIHVSKQLFLRGDHKTYKSAKSCRERWFNHVDPALSKDWTTKDDIMMLQAILQNGKRWALIANQFNHSKNQHMIKNRYYSLLRKAQKQKKIVQQQEDDFIIALIKTLKRQSIIIPKKIDLSQKQQKPQNSNHQPPKKPQQSRQQMKLLTSLQIFPSQTRQINLFQSNSLLQPFIRQAQINQMQEQDQKSQSLKLSKSYQFNQFYPSPVPLTPGADLNLFNQQSSNAFKGLFKFNPEDYVNNSN